MAKRVYRKVEQTPEEEAKLEADREYFQREKPSPDDLAAQGHTFRPLGVVLAIKALSSQLRQERLRQGLSLREVADRAGIDEPALSRLETGKNSNPTLDTLARVAGALGKSITLGLRDIAPPPSGQASPPHSAVTITEQEEKVELPVELTRLMRSTAPSRQRTGSGPRKMDVNRGVAATV